MSNVVVYCMLNGMEVIGTQVNDIDGMYRIEKACVVQLVPQQNGKTGVALAPLLPLAANPKGRVLINKSTVTWTYKPALEIENEYNRVFGSGILQAGQPSFLA